jgi:hypothetical protein
MTSTQPETFKDLKECLNWIKKSVYLIVRVRKIVDDDKNGFQWITIGTGFLAAPKRFLTAAHVINNLTKNDISQHKEGDFYYLIKSDDEGNWHYRYWAPFLDKELFLYPEMDLAVIYLEDLFYKNGTETFMDESTFIRVDQNFHTIGTEAGVLGYPLCDLHFQNGNISSPDLGSVLLRGDKGIINCKLRPSENVYTYEFTMSFNPGNSGGPIFDVNTGKLISIVHGYRSVPINIREQEINSQMKKDYGISKYSEENYLLITQANYSVGIATPTFNEVFKKHGII